MEQWKPIPGYEGYYEISNTGLVRSCARYVVKGNFAASFLAGKPKPTVKGKNGYMMAQLSKDGVNKTYSVHRLVLRAFIGDPPHKYEACHNNGIRDDNRLENLRWDTRVNNFKDREKHGNTAKGERNGCAKVDTETVKAILADTRSNRQIAKQYGLASVTVDRIKSRQSWAHIETDNISPTVKNRRASMKGVSNPSSKLDVDKVKAILADNRTKTAIAKEYGVSRAAIYLIKKGQNWSGVVNENTN